MSSPIRFVSPAHSEGELQIVFDSRQDEANAPRGEVAVEVAQTVGGRDVDFDVGFDVQDEPPDRLLWEGGVLLVHHKRGRARRMSSTLAKNNDTS